MEFIISGASGFIGKAIVNKLLAQGNKVTAIVMEGENNKFESNERLEVVEANFENYINLDKMIKKREYDAFIHMAWAGYGKQTNDYNVQISNIKYTCDAITMAGILGCKRFVFADSSHEYQKNRYQNDETNDLGFCSIYGAAKFSSNRFCRVIAHNSNMEFVGVLFTNVFGVGDFSNRTANFFVSKLNKGENLDLIEGNDLYDWAYIDDVALGVITATIKGIDGKVYYVGNSKLRKFSEIIKDVRDEICPTAVLNFGKYSDSSMIDYNYININELEEDTGFKAQCDFRQSIRKLSNWLKEKE